jgi:hypothetical protein
MASTERSLGWATGVAATDGATTYDSARMSAFERAGLGHGVLLTGSYLAMSGTGTTTLTIADGAAIVGGYFYESNGSVTIATSTLGSATYNVIIIANTAAGNQTVTANGAATTTVVPAVTRIALVTAAQLTTITASITTTNFVALGTVTTSAGTITAIAPYYPYTSTRQQKNTQYCTASGGTVSMPLASTYYDIVGYSSSVNSSDGSMTVNTGTGAFALGISGVYQIDFEITFDTNITGNRLADVYGMSLVNFNLVSAALYATSSTYHASGTQYITVTPGGGYYLILRSYATVSGRSVTGSRVMVTRL